MAEQICPVCGCVVTDKAYEKGGVLYYCEPYTTGGQCQYGCCTIVEEKQEQEE